MKQIIELALAKYPKARRIAVENVVMSNDKIDMAFTMNLEADRAMYSWNAHTVSAIMFAMREKNKDVARIDRRKARKVRLDNGIAPTSPNFENTPEAFLCRD